MGSKRELITHKSELFLQGVEKARQGDHTGAMQIFDQVLQRDPEDANSDAHRCMARHRMGDKKGAIADGQQAAALYL